MSTSKESRRITTAPSDLYDASVFLHETDDTDHIHESHDEDDEDAILITDSLFANPSNQLVQRRNGSTAIDATAIDTSITTNTHPTISQILQEYTTACQIYGCSTRINAGILTTFRYRLPSLRVSGSFFDADMLALVEVLLHHCNGALKYIKRLDFTLAGVEGRQLGKKGIRSHGAYALAKVLEISRYIEEVFLPGNRIGPYGASAIFCAAKHNPTLRTLLMRGCRIGERGAFALVSQLLIEEKPDKEDEESRCGLREIDMSCNQIGFFGVFAIEKGLRNRMERIKARHDAPKNGCQNNDLDSYIMEVDLEGNLIFQEVMNCVTHGLGILLAVIATILLSNEVRGKPKHYVVSCAIYSTSLIVLYLSSTLYHSFFALQRTRYIFQVFDKCSIYILISGSYTPFFTVVVRHQMLLLFVWVFGISGISVEAFAPLWRFKGTFSLVMYLGMGWSCTWCINELIAALPPRSLQLLIAGGVFYTAGVPFFVRNNNLDHSIWHVFVMMGSICHWISIYIVVTQDHNFD